MLKSLRAGSFIAVFSMFPISAHADSSVPTALSEVIARVDLEISFDETDGYVICEVANPTRYSVEGEVSAASGIFNASYENPGFQLHDGTGGIFVLTDSNLGLERGDRVRVTGTTDCTSATLSLNQTDVSSASRKGPVVFAPRQIGELAVAPEILGDPEVTPNWCDCLDPFSATEGDVITVRGNAVADLEKDSVYGFKLFLDDGNGVAQIFIDADSDVPVDRIRNRLLRQGRDLCVTGVVAEFAGVGFELLPRTRHDIRRARPDTKNPCGRRDRHRR
ncbi:MAG: hypothetical protein VCC04_06250 [Myxococcota bacterium]